MANPTVTASLNKTSYVPGEQMTLTVSYGDVDNASFTVTITVEDSQGNAGGPVAVPYNISDAVGVTVVDDSGRAWTKISDSGSVAVFRAIA